MRAGPKMVAVVTADIAGSSRYSGRHRMAIDRVLRKGFRDTVRTYRRAIHSRLAFRVTAGDEFQWVVRDPSRALEVLTYLRAFVASAPVKPAVRFRASIGVGEISVSGRGSTYEQDGSAFVRARRGLEELSKGRGPTRWTKVTTGDLKLDAAADAILSPADLLFSRWTVPQWEAVRWTILGYTRERIAQRIDIAHQNVTKRLAASGWPYLEPAFAFLAQLLEPR